MRHRLDARAHSFASSSFAVTAATASGAVTGMVTVSRSGASGVPCGMPALSSAATHAAVSGSVSLNAPDDRRRAGVDDVERDLRVGAGVQLVARDGLDRAGREARAHVGRAREHRPRVVGANARTAGANGRSSSWRSRPM